MKCYYCWEDPTDEAARGTQPAVETARPIVDDDEILSWFAEMFPRCELDGGILEVQRV